MHAVFPARYFGPAACLHIPVYLQARTAPPVLVTFSLTASTVESGAQATGATPALLVGSLAVINAVFLGLFFLVRWLLHRFQPPVRAAVPTTISRLPRADSATGGGASGVAITGEVAAGPDGPYTAPLSREACAWYRLESFRRRQGIDDVYWEPVSELASEGELVVDDGTGSVRLSMTDVGHFGGWFVRSTSEPQRTGRGATVARVGTALLGRSGLRQDEYVIPVGARVTVIGDLVTADGRMRPAPGAGKLVATPMSVDAWRADQTAQRSKIRRTAIFTYATCAALAALVDGVLIGAIVTSLR